MMPTQTNAQESTVSIQNTELCLDETILIMENKVCGVLKGAHRPHTKLHNTSL